MDAANIKDLAKVRYERACELLEDAKSMLNNDSYKSANNRAYYAAEKAVKAALSLAGKDAETHTGVLRTFNMEFIHTPCAYFDRDDMKNLQSMERIRTSSDYDDFYVANKAECEEQVRKAKNLIAKVEAFLIAEGIDL
ncbi:MAG: HEPN domain-containing protein [Lachnospiraceae bacterium]|nr:HEPN domain-containing protein [Lachnospiraceae bacterium]